MGANFDHALGKNVFMEIGCEDDYKVFQHAVVTEIHTEPVEVIDISTSQGHNGFIGSAAHNARVNMTVIPMENPRLVRNMPVKHKRIEDATVEELLLAVQAKTKERR